MTLKLNGFCVLTNLLLRNKVVRQVPLVRHPAALLQVTLQVQVTEGFLPEFWCILVIDAFPEEFDVSGCAFEAHDNRRVPTTIQAVGFPHEALDDTSGVTKHPPFPTHCIN